MADEKQSGISPNRQAIILIAVVSGLLFHVVAFQMHSQTVEIRSSMEWLSDAIKGKNASTIREALKNLDNKIKEPDKNVIQARNEAYRALVKLGTMRLINAVSENRFLQHDPRAHDDLWPYIKSTKNLDEIQYFERLYNSQAARDALAEIETEKRAAEAKAEQARLEIEAEKRAAEAKAEEARAQIIKGAAASLSSGDFLIAKLTLEKYVRENKDDAEAEKMLLLLKRLESGEFPGADALNAVTNGRFSSAKASLRRRLLSNYRPSSGPPSEVLRKMIKDHDKGIRLKIDSDGKSAKIDQFLQSFFSQFGVAILASETDGDIVVSSTTTLDSSRSYGSKFGINKANPEELNIKIEFIHEERVVWSTSYSATSPSTVTYTVYDRTLDLGPSQYDVHNNTLEVLRTKVTGTKWK